MCKKSQNLSLRCIQQWQQQSQLDSWVGITIPDQWRQVSWQWHSSRSSTCVWAKDVAEGQIICNCQSTNLELCRLAAFHRWLWTFQVTDNLTLICSVEAPLLNWFFSRCHVGMRTYTHTHTILLAIFQVNLIYHFPLILSLHWSSAGVPSVFSQSHPMVSVGGLPTRHRSGMSAPPVSGRSHLRSPSDTHG